MKQPAAVIAVPPYRDYDTLGRWASIPCAVFSAWKLLERLFWLPVPERFPEAAEAFLYFVPDLALIWPLLALGLIFYGEGCRFYLQVRNPAAIANLQWVKTKARLCLWTGLAMTLVAVWIVPLEANAYSALTNEGYIGRNYRTGIVERASWHELSAMEFECWGTLGGGGNRPGLALRFDGVSFAPNMIMMRSYRINRSLAFGHVLDFLERENAKTVWLQNKQHDWFRNGDYYITKCVNELIGHFPPERRAKFRTLLLR